MALKVSGTTVVDDSKNIISGTPKTTGTAVKATVHLVAPSGTTAQRPSSPGTGTLFFDTTLGTLVAYNGSEWV